MEIELPSGYPGWIPAARALEVAAPLVEWAENRLVSIPAAFIMAFNQCPIVAGLCGFHTEIIITAP